MTPRNFDSRFVLWTCSGHGSLQFVCFLQHQATGLFLLRNLCDELGALPGQYQWFDLSVSVAGVSLVVGKKHSLTLALRLGTLCKFTHLFLDLKNAKPWFGQVIQKLSLVYFGAAVFSFFCTVFDDDSYSSASALVFVPILLILGFARIRDGIVEAKYFCVAFVSLLLGSLTLSLTNFGWLPVNLITLHGPQVGSAVEVIVLSWGLARRMKLLMDENLDIQKAAAEELQER